MAGVYLFKGYSKSGKRIHVYLNNGRVDIWYIDTMTRKRWNSEYYTETRFHLSVTALSPKDSGLTKTEEE